jgi:hypothetical protein
VKEDVWCGRRETSFSAIRLIDRVEKDDDKEALLVGTSRMTKHVILCHVSRRQISSPGLRFYTCFYEIFLVQCDITSHCCGSCSMYLRTCKRLEQKSCFGKPHLSA